MSQEPHGAQQSDSTHSPRMRREAKKQPVQSTSPVVFRPERFHFLVATIMLLLMLIPAGHALSTLGVGANSTDSPAASVTDGSALGIAIPHDLADSNSEIIGGDVPIILPILTIVALIIPLMYIIWALRARTIVGEEGIGVRYAFKGTRLATWDHIQGVSFHRSRALVKLKNKDAFVLPCISFNSLPKLAEASRGRIPDALSLGKEAARDKVTIVRKDGEEYLVDKSEAEKLRAEYIKRSQSEET